MNTDVTVQKIVCIEVCGRCDGSKGDVKERFWCWGEKRRRKEGEVKKVREMKKEQERIRFF